MSGSFIRDIHSHGRVGDFLKQAISTNADISIVSAYFTIYAYHHLKQSLDEIIRMFKKKGGQKLTSGRGALLIPSAKQLYNTANFHPNYLNQSSDSPLESWYILMVQRKLMTCALHPGTVSRR